jgi:HD-GYP domain-containing protein (c-di-GMP phosphodiesterase class II)
VLHHHEQFDGHGYPDKLAGHEIPMHGRILAVCDAYDAMTSDRSYRKGMPQERAESILRSGAGKQWDPELIEAFFRCMPDILQIKQNYRPRPPVQRKPTLAVPESVS